MVFKKSSLFFSMFIVTTNCAANDFNVISSQLKPGAEYNLTALFLKAGANNLNYVINNKGLPLQSPSWDEQEVYPHYTFGFELGVRYNFKHTAGSYSNISWTHLNSSSNTSIAADGVNYFLGPDYEIGPIGIPIRHAYGYARFVYDVINIDFGQQIKLNPHVEMHFFASLSTAFLDEKVTAIYTGNTTGTYAGPFSTEQIVSSKFNGIGPRIGIGGDYSFNNNFSILCEGATSALIGTQRANTSYVSSAQQLLVQYGQTVNYQTIADENVYQVIPALDAKIAAKYIYTFNNLSTLKISAGWQAAVYINAISQYIPQSLVANDGIETGGIFVQTMSHQLSNYSVQGPFIKFSYFF